MSVDIKLSVRQLVEFSCRRGDLGGAAGGPSALEGIRAHQLWQRHRGARYQNEVPVRATLDQAHYTVTLNGRIDLLREGQAPLIEEIKSCYIRPERIPQATKDLHWAQLKVYAYCYLNTREAKPLDDDIATLCMTWYCIPEKRGFEETLEINYQHLQKFTHGAVRDYLAWRSQVDAHRRDRNDTAQRCQFPYASFRSGQRNMAAHIYRNMRDGSTLLCEAPTGIGKTVSSLFPAIKALGNGLLDQVVFLTAKNSGRLAATKALRQLTGKELTLSYVVLEAKQRACHCSNGSCQRDDQGVCPRCPGFFDRLPAARDALWQQRHMDSATLDRVAHQFELCPFELALQMLPWCDVVICDYNYVFDPMVALSCFREPGQRTSLLLDEAHNLVDRAREMYSATLNRKTLRRGILQCGNEHPLLVRALKGIDRALGRWHQQRVKEAGDAQSGDWQPATQQVLVSQELPQTVVNAVQRFCDVQASLPSDARPLPAELSDQLRDIYRFGVIGERYADHHRSISSRGVGRFSDIEVKMKCLNAADYLATSFKAFHSASLFSATLRPLPFYREALGLPAPGTELQLPSPFDPARQATLICHHIDTRYRQRRQAIPRLIELLQRVIASKPGNYLVFFASYSFMQQVYDACCEPSVGLDIILQQRNADPAQRAEFLDHFTTRHTTLGFAIMGGVFGEGVDLPGDRLIGTIMVGTGLPGLGIEQDLIRHDFQASGRDGFDFAYRFPGLSRVLQAAGRVIRADDDCGVVILADYRFATPVYRRLLPEHWQLQYCHDNADVGRSLESFWQRQK